MRSHSGRYRGARQADGVVRSRTHQGEDLVEFTVTRPRGGTHPDASPWDGMSGAAMWCADQIVGVVSSPLSPRPEPAGGGGRHELVQAAGRRSACRADRNPPFAGSDRPGRIPIAAAAAKYRAVPAAGPGVLDAAYEYAIAESFVRAARLGRRPSRVLAEDRGSCCFGPTPGSGSAHRRHPSARRVPNSAASRSTSWITSADEPRFAGA